jgi:SAM-dependent methyltransferase
VTVEIKNDHYARTARQFDTWAVERAGYYDAAAGAPRAHTLRTRRVRQLACALLDRHLRGSSVHSLADIGCGRGDFTAELARRFVELERLVGLDFSPEALRLGQSSATDPRVTFARADVRALPLPDRAVDVAIFINALHHVAAEDQARALREVARIARHRIVLEIKNAGNVYYRRLAPRDVAPGVAVYPTTPASVENILRGEGFVLAGARGIFGPIWLSPLVVMSFVRQ